MSQDQPRTTYSEKLKDPRWQRRRLQILERDEWRCQGCSSASKTLHVHHRYYEAGKEPWEYADDALVTVCEDCHEEERTRRRDLEEELLAYLRRTLIVGDLEAFLGSIRGLPVDVLMALARTDNHPGQWLLVAPHVNQQVGEYEDLCRRVDEEIARERDGKD